MSEFAPTGRNPKMTKAQVKAYVAQMKKAQAIAQAKLQQAQNSWELDMDALELEVLEEKLKNL